jgi:two-component system LytT family response regulator
MRCIIVDDESLARERFRSLLRRSGRDIEIIAEADNGIRAIPIIHELKPDIVFLDIQMPGLSGFEVIDLLARPRPHIVFVTAYDEYALQAFEARALDYLTKPVRLERLEKTLDYAADLHLVRQADARIEELRTERQNTRLNRLTVQNGNALRVIDALDILRIEAEDKYVHIFLSDGQYRTDFTLDELAARLDPQHFLRIHRSHIVRLGAVREIIPWFSGSYCVKLSDGTQLPVARRRAAELKDLFGRK